MNRSEGGSRIEEVVDRKSCSIGLTKCPLDGHRSAHGRSVCERPLSDVSESWIDDRLDGKLVVGWTREAR